MAGVQITPPLDPALTGDDWTNILALNERADKGSEGISLTEWATANTNKPEIAAGSVIEIGGAIFNYVSDEAIVDSGGLADGWVYIKHVVAGAAGSQTITPTLTNTFGTWDTAKQGYYDGNDRYSLFAMYRSGAITKIFTEKSVKSHAQTNERNIPIDTDEEYGTYIDRESPNNAGAKLKHQIIRAVGNGTTTINFTHSILNAGSNNRILDVRWSVYNTVTGFPSGGDNRSPNYIKDWTAFDTYIRVIHLSSTSALSTHVLLVTYI